MKKLSLAALTLCLIGTSAFAQYKGKYEGWSTGYLFTGSMNAKHYKAFTHIMDFGPTISSSGSVGGGKGSSFVTQVHGGGDKAMICFGGQGNSSATSSACATAAGRTKVVKNMIAAALKGGYDGIDMDWEPGEEGGFDGNAAKVEMFRAFHKELRDSIDAQSKKLIFTAAVVFDWYPNCSAAIAPYVDQANSMTYYDPVGKMPELLGAGALKGTDKKRVGVGFGWDSDGEVTATSDILAKCRWAIDNGFGGIMGWHIAAASGQVLDSIATYVTHDAAVYVLPTPGQREANAIALRADYDAMKRLRAFNCIVPKTNTGSAQVDLRMYDASGSLVKVLFQGNSAPGTISLPVESGAFKPGAYFVRLNAGATAQSLRAEIVR